MLNTLYLPELHEMLAENNTAEMREFCAALNPGRTAECMEGLTPAETWAVLRHADPADRIEIFTFLDEATQVEIIATQDREEIAGLIAELPPDDRVDMLKEVEKPIVDELLAMLPAEERRDIMRLRAYPEETAGAVMTTEVAKLSEHLTVGQALDELRRQAEGLETIYYLYTVDDQDHLRGIVSSRQLISSMGRPDTPLSELMETDVLSVDVDDDQEVVAQKVARYDLIAIPVVDAEHHMLGIITADDVMDVVREEATEDAHRIAGVAPLREGYLQTGLLTLGWKRGIWLTLLFGGSLLTALALQRYEAQLDQWIWLVLFLPLIISCGGNSGNQSATLIITALTVGDIELADWRRVIRRELLMGLLLGGFLGLFSMALVFLLDPADRSLRAAMVVPVTLPLVVVSGTLAGSLLPLTFKRLGLDPALMSSPFMAGIIDILGIVIYVNVAIVLLTPA